MAPTSMGSRGRDDTGGFERGRDSGFQIRVEGADLAQFIQMECMSGTRRAFRVISRGIEGFLFVRDGRVVHAIAGAEVGERAAIAILGWSDGTIAASPHPWPATETITATWQSILLRAAHARDEAARGNVVPFPAEAVSEPAANASNPAGAAQKNDRGPVTVRIDAEGEVLTGRGGGEELAPLASYARRLLDLIGEDLGVGKLAALDARTQDGHLMIFVDDGDLVAMESDDEAELAPLRKRLGIL